MTYVALDTQHQPGGEIFPAKITGNTTISGAIAHSWVEMEINPAARAYQVKEFGLSGDASLTPPINPAYDLNGGTITTNTIVFLRLRGWVGDDGGHVYDILSSSSGASGTNRIVVVTGVCLTVS